MKEKREYVIYSVEDGLRIYQLPSNVKCRVRNGNIFGKYFRNISGLTFFAPDLLKNRFCKYLITQEKGKGGYEKRPELEGIVAKFGKPF